MTPERPNPDPGQGQAQSSGIASDDEIERRVTEHYLSSRDFNGLPVRELFALPNQRESIREALTRLLKADSITMEFGIIHVNPYIKALPPPPVSQQLEWLASSDLAHACAYPTPRILSGVVGGSDASDRPFTRRLMLGEPQLAFHAFDLSVLEFYRNDPRYHYQNDDIRGWISVADEFFEPEPNSTTPSMPEHDQVFLQTFGFGYDDAMRRAVVVFTRYLSGLSAEHQQVWSAKKLDGTFKLHPDYWRNAMGEWGTKMSVFEAFTAELRVINQMASALGKPPLFRNEYQKRPRGFSFLVRPTSKEFDDFVLLLDQMMSDNLNKVFFKDDVDLETETVRKDGKIVVAQKGTIQLLDDWVRQKVRLPNSQPFDSAIAAFRKVRKLRQKPAHSAEDSQFDEELIKEQRLLILDAYAAVRTLRMLFANHPAAAACEVPESLFRGDIWQW